MSNTFSKIYETVKKIPKGNVSTYGQIALMVGNPHLARVVGYALHQNPDPIGIPCHRVVNRFGRLAGSYAFEGEEKQREKLTAEGITFKNNLVDLEKHMWSGK